ncbi:MAG: hypothetical protein DRI65_18360 [Chloroflexota bacterium]|nr:MAG: hypothetical protein DRI65_18360 [Chloroflexota bacterium]
MLSIALIRALEVFDLETAALITTFEIESNLTTERERIGRELHDQTIQNLYVSGLLIDSVKRNTNLDEKYVKNLDRALGGLDSAITSLRKYIGKLQPDHIDSNLAVSIRTKANDARFSSLFSIELEINLPKNAIIEPSRAHHILDILGESLSNIARHANAKRVNILAKRIDGDLELVIEDDGKGFEFDSTSPGFGLRNMHDRARLLGGKLMIDSHPKQGTKVKLLVPWEEAK